MRRALMRLLTEETAATSVEYAVMLALILLVAIGAITQLGGANGGMWFNIEQDITAATGY